jgi:hypothetical protein
VFFNFSTGPGDVTNALSQDPTSAVNLVHPIVRDSVELQSGGAARDRRYLEKVTDRGSPLTIGAHTSDLSWTRYPTPSSSIPIIRNEELILLRAEANLRKAAPDLAAAARDLNFIRRVSGGLDTIPNLGGQAADSILHVLLKQRLYSLMYEGGHRWIDARRYGRLALLPVTAGDQVFGKLPIPLAEVQARQ